MSYHLRNCLIVASVGLGMCVSSGAFANDVFYSSARGGWLVEGAFIGELGLPTCTAKSPGDGPLISISRGADAWVTDRYGVIRVAVPEFQNGLFSHGQRFPATGTFIFREGDDTVDQKISYDLEVEAVEDSNGKINYEFTVRTWGDGKPRRDFGVFKSPDYVGFLVYFMISKSFSLKTSSGDGLNIDISGSDEIINKLLVSCPKSYINYYNNK